jgi:ribose-phosphate pyrophosphokinase
MIASGTTLARTAMACQAGGAKKVIGMATHGAFTAGAAAVLAHPALDELVITDTIPPQRLSAPDVQRKLSVLDTSGFIAEAIRRLHEHGSLVELVQDDL